MPSGEHLSPSRMGDRSIQGGTCEVVEVGVSYLEKFFLARAREAPVLATPHWGVTDSTNPLHCHQV